MDRDRFGIPRPLVGEDGKGPLNIDRPLVDNEKERLIAEIESNIEDESSAETKYQKTIDMLEQQGYPELASQVRDIQKDEIRHNREFKSILSTIRRDWEY